MTFCKDVSFSKHGLRLSMAIPFKHIIQSKSSLNSFRQVAFSKPWPSFFIAISLILWHWVKVRCKLSKAGIFAKLWPSDWIDNPWMSSQLSIWIVQSKRILTHRNWDWCFSNQAVVPSFVRDFGLSLQRLLYNYLQVKNLISTFLLYCEKLRKTFFKEVSFPKSSTNFCIALPLNLQLPYEFNIL